MFEQTSSTAGAALLRRRAPQEIFIDLRTVFVYNREALTSLSFPVVFDARIVNVGAIREEEMRAALDPSRPGELEVLLDGGPSAPVSQCLLQRVCVESLTAGGNLEDLVTHRDRPALGEQAKPKGAIQVLTRLQPLFLGGLHGLEREQGGYRPLGCMTLPHLPAGIWLEPSDDGYLRIEDALWGGLFVDELERKRAEVETDPVLETELGPGAMQPVHGRVSPRSSDVGENDDGSGSYLDVGAHGAIR
jgi:hypothetical protein